mgnify:CR=1 FL=1
MARARVADVLGADAEIVADVAHAIDPAIPLDRIRSAAANRQGRFAAAFANVPAETLAVLRKLKDQGKKLCLCSNADAMESAHWDACPLAPPW